MQYLLLIYEDEAVDQARSDADRQKLFADYGTFTEDLKKSGKMLAGDALQPTPTATTVRCRGGDAVLTDGPFAETKEQLGGYYLIEAADLDEACAIAARIPTSRTGSIEVRPVLIYE
jgi:hypothetical protein